MSRARVLAADNPWKLNDSLPGKTRGASKRYKTLTVAQLKAYPLPQMLDDSLCFFWYLTSMVDEAREVVRAWGFEPTGGELTWLKTTSPGEFVIDPMSDRTLHTHGSTKLAFGMGRTVRNVDERCLIASRGAPKLAVPLEAMGLDERCLIARRGKPKLATKSVRSVFFAPLGEHSAKPDRFYQLVEQLAGGPRGGPYVELFARRHRPGWTCYGDQLPGGKAHP